MNRRRSAGIAGGGGRGGRSFTGATRFTDLSDCPSEYTGKAAYFATVNPTENGLIFTELPPIAITEVFVVNSEEEMLSLVAQVGDVAVRTDIGQSFILQTADPAFLSHWILLLISPTHAMDSALHTAGTIAGIKTKISDGSIFTTKPGEIFAITEKIALSENDMILIEDSTDGNAKKKAKITTLLNRFWLDPVLSVYDNTAGLPGEV